MASFFYDKPKTEFEDKMGAEEVKTDLSLDYLWLG